MRIAEIENTRDMTELLNRSIEREEAAMAVFPEGSNVLLVRGVSEDTAELSDKLSFRYARFLHLPRRRLTSH